MTPIDKLAWVHIHRQRILCVRSRGRDVFFVPGGKREPGESDEQALLREVREELGVALDPGSIRPLGVFEGPAHGQPEGTLVRLKCFTAHHAGEPQAAAEIEEAAWLGYADRHRLSVAGQILFDWLHEHHMLL